MCVSYAMVSMFWGTKNVSKIVAYLFELLTIDDFEYDNI